MTKQSEKPLFPNFDISNAVDRPLTKKEKDQREKTRKMLLKNAQKDWKQTRIEETKKIIEQLKNTTNDPNLIMTTSFVFGDKK